MSPFRVILAISLLCLCTSGIVRAADSLYDKEAARQLTASEQSGFGPQAGKFKYDKRMIHAAEIAAERARGHSISRCWRYVKNALLASKTINSYPTTEYAKQAASELPKSSGFKKIGVSDPFKAPIGSVLVYGGRGAGHVEIRTKGGFVSDFFSKTPSKRPLLGIYVKPPV